MNKKISAPIAIGIILILAVMLGGYTFLQYSMLNFNGNYNNNLIKNYCNLNLDCDVTTGCGGCNLLCVNKNNYVPEKCDPNGPKCEMAIGPLDQICGCVNNQCKFSNDIFEQYGEIKNKALDLVLSDYKEAMNYCSQLHQNYLLDCYSRIAEKMLPISTSKADEICSNIADKYFIGNSVENDCYFTLARKVVGVNSDLAITFCSKSSENGSPNEYSVNNKNYCIRDIGLEIARSNNLTKAFGICDINGLQDGRDAKNFCKSYIITQTYDYIDDPALAFEKISEPEICEKANFSIDLEGKEYDYYGECKNLYTIIDASVLAKDGETEEAINICNKITDEHVHDTISVCYKKVAIAVSNYDINKAKSICEKISVDSTKIECKRYPKIDR